MKTPESLHTKILDAARDEVARERGASSFEYYEKHMVAMDNHEYLAYAHEQAALAAMKEQAAFYEWILLEDEWQLCLYQGNLMYVERAHSEDSGLAEDFFKTDLELYEIFTTQQ